MLKKNQILKIIVVCLLAFFSANLFAQYDKSFTMYQIDGDYPEVDGNLSDWKNIYERFIEQLYVGVNPDSSLMETVSMINGQRPWFKTIWSDDFVYMAFYVPDDDIYFIEDTVDGIEDEIHLYFDLDPCDVDGKGPSDVDGTTDDGHYRLELNENSTFENDGIVSAFSLSDDSLAYQAELRIPTNFFADFDEGPIYFYVLGFDISVFDIDRVGFGENIEQGRVNLSNNGLGGDSYDNMDSAAKMVFSYDYYPGIVKSKYYDPCDLVAFYNEEIDDGLIEISPNPTQSSFNVSSKYKMHKIGIYDTFGRLLEKKQINEQEAEISISNLCTGIYIVKVKTKYGWASEYLIVE